MRILNAGGFRARTWSMQAWAGCFGVSWTLFQIASWLPAHIKIHAIRFSFFTQKRWGAKDVLSLPFLTLESMKLGVCVWMCVCMYACMYVSVCAKLGSAGLLHFGVLPQVHTGVPKKDPRPWTRVQRIFLPSGRPVPRLKPCKLDCSALSSSFHKTRFSLGQKNWCCVNFTSFF